MMDSLVGQSIAGYRIEQAIQLDGLAEVYMGKDSNQQPVVIKLLRGRFAIKNEMQKRFEREIELLKTIHHPNVIPITDSGFTDNYLYLVMPFIKGYDLGHLLNQRRFSVQEVGEFLQPISQAVSSGHALKIIHRDLKPENILVEVDGEKIIKYYLSDFGLAKRPGIDETLTNAGMKVGTPEYISPESVLNKAVDHRSDIYSLAILVYEMLIGEVPFMGKMMAVVMAHAKSTPTPLNKQNSEFPLALSAVVMRNLAKDPDQRHQTMTEFAQAFQTVIDHLPAEIKSRNYWIR